MTNDKYVDALRVNTAVLFALVASWSSAFVILFHPSAYHAYAASLNPTPFRADSLATVRWVWSNSADPLELAWGQLDRREVQHFGDVARLLARARHCALVSIVVALGSMWMLEPRARIAGARSLAVLGSALTIAALGFAAVGWRDAFETVHGWFFRSDTWIFAPASYSLQMFPRIFWQQVAPIYLTIAFGLACLPWALLRSERTTAKSNTTS